MESRETDRYLVIIVDQRGLVVGDTTPYPDIFKNWTDLMYHYNLEVAPVKIRIRM